MPLPMMTTYAVSVICARVCRKDDEIAKIKARVFALAFRVVRQTSVCRGFRQAEACRTCLTLCRRGRPTGNRRQDWFQRLRVRRLFLGSRQFLLAVGFA